MMKTATLHMWEDVHTITFPFILQNLIKLALQICHKMFYLNFYKNTFTTHDYSVCGQQRHKGMLYGVCEDGLGPTVMSYTHPCVECKWYGWLLYIVLLFVPATILCFLIVPWRVNVLSPPLNALYSGHNFLCKSHTMQLPIPCSCTRTSCFHSQTCLASSHALTVSSTWIFLSTQSPHSVSAMRCRFLPSLLWTNVIALYPLTLVAVIYLLIEIHNRECWLFNRLWRPFHKLLIRFRKNWDIKGSIINAFATLYVLSFTKVMSTSIRLMLTTDIQTVCGIHYHKTHLYYNASCSLFKACHRPYAYLMFTVFITVILLPVLYIFLHSCKLFHKYNFLNKQFRLMLL